MPLANDPSWFGLIAPARLAPEPAARLHGALLRALKQPETGKRLEATGAVAVGSAPEEFRKMLAASIDNTRNVVREAGLKFD